MNSFLLKTSPFFFIYYLYRIESKERICITMYNNTYFTVMFLNINQWLLFGAVILLGASMFIEPRYRKMIRRKMKIEKRSATVMETVSLAAIHYAAYVAIAIEVIVFVVAMFKASGAITSML